MFSNLGLVPIYLIKVYVSNGFYRIFLFLQKSPNLSLVFTTVKKQQYLDWHITSFNNGVEEPPPCFFCRNWNSGQHVKPIPSRSLSHKIEKSGWQSRGSPQKTSPWIKPHIGKYVQLPQPIQIQHLTTCLNRGFCGWFPGAGARCWYRHRHVLRTIFYSLEKLFRPWDVLESTHYMKVLSLKKLYTGDWSWSNIQVLLNWVVDTLNMTLCLPQNGDAHF